MKRREDKPEPQPRPFVRSAHFEALRVIRRKQPALYISMSVDIKAQLELYCDLRRRAENNVQVLCLACSQKGSDSAECSHVDEARRVLGLTA